MVNYLRPFFPLVAVCMLFAAAEAQYLPVASPSPYPGYPVYQPLPSPVPSYEPTYRPLPLISPTPSYEYVPYFTVNLEDPAISFRCDAGSFLCTAEADDGSYIGLQLNREDDGDAWDCTGELSLPDGYLDWALNDLRQRLELGLGGLLLDACHRTTDDIYSCNLSTQGDLLSLSTGADYDQQNGCVAWNAGCRAYLGRNYISVGCNQDFSGNLYAALIAKTTRIRIPKRLTPGFSATAQLDLGVYAGGRLEAHKYFPSYNCGALFTATPDACRGIDFWIQVGTPFSSFDPSHGPQLQLGSECRAGVTIPFPFQR